MQIVLARLNEGLELVRRGRVDLGERHTFKSVAVPVSLMWLRDGTEADVTKAQAYAASEGYSVFCYDKNETKPLERARQDIRESKS